MKIGIDIHGVITRYPDLFRELARSHINWGHEVHIITGAPREKATETLLTYGFTEEFYTHFFSIVDFHRKKGTKMWINDRGSWQMKDTIWWKTKTLYWKKAGIDIHYDDSPEYNHYFTRTVFVLVK